MGATEEEAVSAAAPAPTVAGSSATERYPIITPVMAEEAVREQRVAELEMEIQKLKNQNLTLEAEVKERDSKVAALEMEIAEYAKDPRFKRHEGPPVEWSSSLWSCLDNQEICLKGLFCPCVLFGQTAASIMNWDDMPGQDPRGGCLHVQKTLQDTAETSHQCIRCCTAGTIHLALGGCVQLLSVWILGPLAAVVTLAPCYTYEYRTKLRQHYHLKEGPLTDFCTSCLCHPCALCQEAREIEIREKSAATEVLKKTLKDEIKEELKQESKHPQDANKGKAPVEAPTKQEMKK